MAYTRTTTIDASPTGDTAKQAVLDLDTDLTGAFAGLNSLDAAKLARSTVTTKGDLLAATGSATIARVAVGTAGQALVADSTAAAGVAWKTISSSPWAGEFFS